MDQQTINAFLLACLNGYIPEVRRLLEATPQVINQADEEGWTALIDASSRGHRDIVHLLLNNGADVDARTKNGWTALMKASISGHRDIVQLLLKNGADVHARNKYGSTALMKAIDKGDIYISQLLLKNGADVDARDKHGSTALMLASSKGHVAAVQLLLEKGADVNVTNKDGSTALIMASSYGDIATAQLLLEKGADINAKNKNGSTALMVASGNGYGAAVQLLLEMGADINVTDETGHTALDTKYDDIRRLLKKRDAIWLVQCAKTGDITEVEKVLVANPLVINAQDEDGNTALMHAYLHSNIEMMLLLLDRGADMSIPNKNGETLLSLVHEKSMILGLVNWFRSRLISKPSYSYWRNLIYPSSYLDPPYSNIMRDSEAHAVLDVLFDSLSYRAAEDDASTCRLHLCGEGLSGKSCLYAQLRSMLPLSSDVSDNKQFSKNMSDCLHDGMDDKDIDVWMRGKNRVEVDPGDRGRTKGIRISTVRGMRHQGTQFIIYDYGGQKEFLINHGSFLSAPGSVYIVVLPLWNKKENKKYEDEDIVSRYSFWLRFIHSVTNYENKIYKSASRIPIITIINRFDDGYGNCVCGRNEIQTEMLVGKLKKEFAHFGRYFVAVSPTGLTAYFVLPMNCDRRDGAEALMDPLRIALNHLKQQPRTMYPVARLLRNDIDSTSGWELVMTHEEWMERAYHVITAHYPKMNEIKNRRIKSYMLEMLANEALESLIHAGAILKISNHSYITSPNKVTNQVLGAMLREMAKPLHASGHVSNSIESMLRKRLDEFNGIVAEMNLQESVMFEILRSVGLTVPLSKLPADSDVTHATVKSDINHFYYVVHGLLSEDMPNEWCLPFSGATRVLTRTFMLANKNTDMFYPGYFAALFRQVLALEKASTVNIWRNGMDLQTRIVKYNVQINISPAGKIEDGFRVIVATNEACVDEQYDYALETMKKIRDIVFESALNGISVIEYCEQRSAHGSSDMFLTSDVEMSMIAMEHTTNRFFHTLYCGQYPSQQSEDRIAELLNKHGQKIVECYRNSVVEIVSNANTNTHELNELLRKLFKQSDETTEESEKRMIIIVRNLLEDEFDKGRKILVDIALSKTQAALDAVHGLSKAVVELQGSMTHGLSDLLRDVIAQNNIIFDKMSSECRNSLSRKLDDLRKHIQDDNNQNFEAMQSCLSDTVRSVMSELETLRTQMQDSDENEIRALQKLQNRLDGIEQSMERVLTAEDAEKILKNTVLAQLRDDVATILDTVMSESNECMQEISEQLLMSIETQIKSVEMNLLRQGTENTAHTEQVVENLNAEIANLCVLLEKVEQSQSDVSVASSLEDIVTKQLQQFNLSEDTRYDQIHAMLMEHGRALKAIRTMQENVIYSATEMPLLWSVSETIENLFSTEYHIQCVCCVCGEKVRGGLTESKQREKGYYELKVNRKWVKRTLKFLKITMRALEIVGGVAGLPLPKVSSLVGVLEECNISEEQVREIQTAFETAVLVQDRINVVNTAIHDIMNATGLSAALQKKSGDATVPSIPQSISLLYVAEIRNLLKVLGVDLPPRYCGLQAVKDSDGNWVWLCVKSSDQDPNPCMTKFERLGMNGLKYYPIFK